jgi:hypothetical protein
MIFVTKQLTIGFNTVGSLNHTRRCILKHNHYMEYTGSVTRQQGRRVWKVGMKRGTSGYGRPGGEVKTLATSTGDERIRKTWRRRGQNPSDDAGTSTGDERIRKTCRRRGQNPSEDATSTGDDRIRKDLAAARSSVWTKRRGQNPSDDAAGDERIRNGMEECVPAERMPRKGRRECGRGRRTDAAEEQAAVEGES